MQEIHVYDSRVVCEKRGDTTVCSKCVDYVSKRQLRKLARIKKKLEALKNKSKTKKK